MTSSSEPRPKFERFDTKVRRALVNAQSAAKKVNAAHITSEHLLTGMLDVNGGSGIAALRHFGVDLGQLREQVAHTHPERAEPPPEYPPFHQSMRQALELSFREALLLGQDHIGSGHLLLGLMQVDKCASSAALVQAGLEVVPTRVHIAALLGSRWTAGQQPAAGRLLPLDFDGAFAVPDWVFEFTAEASKAIWSAFRIAMDQRETAVEVRHLLAGLWELNGSNAVGLLKFYGLTMDDIVPTFVWEPEYESPPTAMSDGMRALIEQAISIAEELGTTRISSDILLGAISRTEEGAQVLREVKLRPTDVDMIVLERALGQLKDATPSAMRALRHAAYLSEISGNPRVEATMLLAALLLKPWSEHARITNVFMRFGLEPDNLIGEYYRFDKPPKDLRLEVLEATMGSSSNLVCGEILDVLAAAQACTARTGDIAVDTVHLFVAVFEVSERRTEDGFRTKPGDDIASELEEFALLPDLVITTGSQVRYLTGDADRALITATGIASEQRGPVPQPAERYGIPISNQLQGWVDRPLTRFRKRIYRPRLSSGADTNSPWHDFMVARYIWLSILQRLIGLVLVVGMINAIVEGAPWWILFGVMWGFGSVTTIRGVEMALYIVLQSAAAAILWLGGALWMWPLGLLYGGIGSYLKITELHWRQRDTGDPDFDSGRHRWGILVSWLYLGKRGRGVR
jgi:hypothetical protein